MPGCVQRDHGHQAHLSTPSPFGSSPLTSTFPAEDCDLSRGLASHRKVTWDVPSGLNESPMLTLLGSPELVEHSQQEVEMRTRQSRASRGMGQQGTVGTVPLLMSSRTGEPQPLSTISAVRKEKVQDAQRRLQVQTQEQRGWKMYAGALQGFQTTLLDRDATSLPSYHFQTSFNISCPDDRPNQRHYYQFTYQTNHC